MKIIKYKLNILIVILFVNVSFGQTLKVSDFRKAFNYDKPTQHKQLLSKGFKLLSDTIAANQKKFKFNNPNSKEIIELTFTEDGEGGEYLSILYFLTAEFTYKNFISTLTAYKFKYSKRNTRYQLPASSYSGENIYLNGLTSSNGKKYYSLKYESYKDKALSGPRPEFTSDKIPIVDSIRKPK
jgi:hypothetical protein